MAPVSIILIEAAVELLEELESVAIKSKLAGAHPDLELRVKHDVKVAFNSIKVEIHFVVTLLVCCQIIVIQAVE